MGNKSAGHHHHHSHHHQQQLIKAERQRCWFTEPLATLSLSASAAAAAAAAASLTTDPLAAEDLLLSWYSLYQPRPQPAAPGPMLAAMSTLMMPAAAMTLAGHPLSALPAPHQPKPQDLLTLPGPLPIAHLTLKAMNGHNSAAAQQALANGLALGAAAGNNLCLTSSSMVGGSSNSNKAGMQITTRICNLQTNPLKSIRKPGLGRLFCNYSLFLTTNPNKLETVDFYSNQVNQINS